MATTPSARDARSRSPSQARDVDARLHPQASARDTDEVLIVPSKNRWHAAGKPRSPRRPRIRPPRSAGTRSRVSPCTLAGSGSNRASRDHTTTSEPARTSARRPPWGIGTSSRSVGSQPRAPRAHPSVPRSRRRARSSSPRPTDTHRGRTPMSRTANAARARARVVRTLRTSPRDCTTTTRTSSSRPCSVPWYRFGPRGCGVVAIVLFQ